MKCCVYTRAFMETPYLDFFIEHYCNLGFNKIIILKSDEFYFECYDKYKSRVDIHSVKNLENRLLSLYDKLLKKSDYDWALCVDIDEFLLLNNNYINIHQYIEEKLSKENNINTFYFRWGMIEKFDNDDNYVFKNIINDYNIYSNSHVKSMIKISALDSVHHPHICRMKEKLCIYFEEKILNKPQPNNHSITHESYSESILLHLHTRNINNLVLKSIVTNLGDSVNRNVKKINNLPNFINLITYNSNYKDEQLLEKMIDTIGIKAKLPYDHSNISKTNTNIVKLKDYYIYDYNFDTVNVLVEKEILNTILKKHNINKNKYYEFINRINNILLKEGRFKS